MNRDKKYDIIKGPYSLKELVAKEKFPQMLQVTKGFYAPTEKETISEGQIMVAYFVKRIKVVRAAARNEVFSIPLNSSMKFSILAKEGVQPFYKTAADLASAPVVPDVVACRSVTLDNQGQVIRPGTVLFPVMDKKGMKQKLKIGGQKSIKFLSTRGEKLKVPLDSESGFTTHLEDTKMYISEIIQHFPLPVKVRCMTSGKNFLGTNFLHELTLKETKEEASLIGGFKLDEGEEDYLSKCPFDLPLDLLVEVVCVKAHDNNEQFSMYEEVRTTYESKRSRVAPYKKLLSNCNTHDRAQMELYNTVREEMSEHVVDVEVPENIYDEIIPFECVGTSKPPPKNTGPSLPPKGIKPDMDYVQLTKSTPEKDPPITTPKPSNVPQQLPGPGSYQPLQPVPSTYIESAYQPLNNKVPSEKTSNVPTGDKVKQEMSATARQFLEEYPDYDIPRCHPPKKKTSADDTERKITPPSTKHPPPVFPKTKKTPPPAPIRRCSELSQETKEKPPTAPRPTFVKRHSEIPADAKDKPWQICAEHTPPHIPPQPFARQNISQSPPSRVLPQIPPSHVPLQSPPSHAPLQSPPSHAPLQSPPSHAPLQSPPSHAPLQSPPSHAPLQSPPSHAPLQSPPSHVPPQSPATHIPQQPLIMTPNPPNPEENIEFLKTLDCHGILDLVHVMKLSQYQDQFIQEHVDGELLSCMEDTELVELGITSSLHRKRFLKIIEGKHSARLYLEEGDPYGTVTMKQPVDK